MLIFFMYIQTVINSLIILCFQIYRKIDLLLIIQILNFHFSLGNDLINYFQLIMFFRLNSEYLFIYFIYIILLFMHKTS